ncbi:actin-like ATPase domain-containing protein [Xylona heveae TC161]|uniref:Phosphotransferase n=1 Tax=Xylona heveae (strain CBS 132557 / TC161) TaxID=1328760 RepID=A0A165H933_XYLHT|nr:actin-like ATPase domain-containing protein [Xylona heveae TC161]KZF23158.1 actin-like ATPase domain-containing protein [Xylona heveae TC161]
MAGDNIDDSLDGFLSPLIADTSRLYRLALQFSITYRQLAWDSSDQFLPTPITTLPSGTETGRFLAIDVGGTNLRVGFIELHGDKSSSTSVRDVNVCNGSEESRNGCHSPSASSISRKYEKSWPIGEHLKMDKAEDLFTWIGDCIAEVVRECVDSESDVESSGNFAEERRLAMGITFSFPMIQTSLAEATLMPMGKGFAITSNLNLGKLLLAGYERHTRQVSRNGESMSQLDTIRSELTALPRLHIAAITNDTVATLASLAYRASSLPNRRVAMGLIVGTGTNATIPLNIRHLSPSKRASIEVLQEEDEQNIDVVINTEWTIKGTAPPLRRLDFITKWDALLDEASEAPGFQPFEYMTAGRYMGEIVRLVMLDVFVKLLGWNQNDLPEIIRRRNTLSTAFLATTVAKSIPDRSLVLCFEDSFPPPKQSKWIWSEKAVSVIRQIALFVQARSARLIAAAIVGLLAFAGDIQLEELAGALADKRCELNATKQTGPPRALESPSSGELIVAYTGGTISHYPRFLEDCQQCLDELLDISCQRPGVEYKRIVLCEARDGGIIGAGVLAGTAYIRNIDHQPSCEI